MSSSISSILSQMTPYLSGNIPQVEVAPSDPQYYEIYSDDRFYQYLKDDNEPDKSFLEIIGNVWDTFVPTLTGAPPARQLQCNTCQTFSKDSQKIMGNEIVKGLLVDALILACEDIIGPATGFKTETCPGIITQQFGDSIYPLIVDELWSEQILCEYIFPVCNIDKHVEMTVHEWIEQRIDEKTFEAQQNDFINNLYKEHDLANPRPKDELIKIALISDLHLSFDYTIGADTDCGKPLCCRSDSGINKNADKNAKKWGDYNCDLPVHTLENLFDFVNSDIKPDAVMWGGDSIPHNLDSLQIDNSVQIMKNVTKIVADKLSDYPIYPTIGNHDTYPQDIFKMLSPRSNPAVNRWSPEWLQFIPDEEQQKTFLDWGYFAIPLVGKDGKQLGNANTKIVSLNTNICYENNFEVMTQFSDPGNMLDWLDKLLQELLDNNGTAIMIAHVPNIDECTREFGRRYHSILDKFQTVIRWGMYSHEHQEQYQVARDIFEGKPIGMNFIVSSATTYQGKPPSFNVIYLDPDTMLPVEYESYALDLDHANEHDETIWSRKFNYRETYNLPDLSPQSFYDHSHYQIMANETAAIEYRNHRYLDGPGGAGDFPCDRNCRMMFYCQTVANDYDEWMFCRGNPQKHWRGGEQDFIETLEEAVAHGWYRPPDSH